jgi:hypothetical protein
MTATIRIACPASRCGPDCESCNGLGHLDVKVNAEPKHATSPCCGAAYVAHPDGEWTCVACGKVWRRKEIVGW